MKRNRIAMCAIILLALFWTSGFAVQKSAPASAPVEASDILQSDAGDLLASLATGPLDKRTVPPKAGEREYVPPAADQKVSYPVSAGTGGGDMPEIEPNNTAVLSNESHDVPFDCIGTVGFAGDSDWTSVRLTAGMSIQANVTSKLFGGINSPLDPMLFVYADNGTTIITANDDVNFPADLNSQVNFVAPYTGMVYFVVRAAYGWMGGAAYKYVLTVFPVPGQVWDPVNFESEPNNDTVSADLLVLPGVKIGVIATPGDIDYTYFDVPSTATAVVDVCGNVLEWPTDSAVILRDSAGRMLFYNDDMDGVDPRFNIVLPPGRYFLGVYEYHGTSGPLFAYLVNVTLQDSAASPLVTKLKFSPAGLLKKVTGVNFVPGGSAVEHNGGVIVTVPSAPKPTTVIKVKPNFPVGNLDRITVRNPNGRRSNAAVIVE